MNNWIFSRLPVPVVVLHNKSAQDYRRLSLILIELAPTDGPLGTICDTSTLGRQCLAHCTPLHCTALHCTSLPNSKASAEGQKAGIVCHMISQEPRLTPPAPLTPHCPGTDHPICNSGLQERDSPCQGPWWSRPFVNL
jgi:hypothetical protein